MPKPITLHKITLELLSRYGYNDSFKPLVNEIRQQTNVTKRAPQPRKVLPQTSTPSDTGQFRSYANRALFNSYYYPSFDRTYTGNDLRGRSIHILSQTMRDTAKMSRRQQLLEKHPELRVRVNTDELRQTVDYVSFLCHPQCSISRDQAIKGSDIDKGLVVTREPVSEEKQQEFINKLREQGFNCYTEAEAEALAKEVKQYKYSDPQYKELHSKKVEAELSHIIFRTIDQIKESEAESGLLKTEVLVYHGGREIKYN